MRTCACACGCCCCMGVCCCCCVRACVRACGCCVCVRACVCVCVQVDETIRLNARGQVGWFLDLSVPSTAQSPQDEQTFFFSLLTTSGRTKGHQITSKMRRVSCEEQNHKTVHKLQLSEDRQESRSKRNRSEVIPLLN